MQKKLPPTPQDPDVRKIVWQQWFTSLNQLIADIYESIRLINLQLSGIAADIIFVSSRPQYRSKTGLPTLSDQALGTYSIWRNNADATFRLAVNDGSGAIKLMVLTLT